MNNFDDDSIKCQLRNAREKLQTISETPSLDAELLLAHCLSKTQTYLHTWPEKILSNEEINDFTKLIKKRQTDYPVAYLLGKKDFWTLSLHVTPDVLIPRPETELLVELALDKVSDIKNPKILDLGTGSGAIALALASERSDSNIIACDYSVEALEIAKRNMIDNGLDGRVKFIESNWFSNIHENEFDLIVSNPPYIDSDDPHLKESIRYEPLQALVADNCGLQDIETIILESKNHLKEGGFVMLEHGYNQAIEVLERLYSEGYCGGENTSDLNQNPRVSFAQKD